MDKKQQLLETIQYSVLDLYNCNFIDIQTKHELESILDRIRRIPVTGRAGVAKPSLPPRTDVEVTVQPEAAAAVASKAVSSGAATQFMKGVKPKIGPGTLNSKKVEFRSRWTP
jgi:hypothetical protein